MSLENYKIFDEVVKQKSFTKTSEVLNLTPSAISHSISKLEQTFGFRLLIRNRKGVQLTSYGRDILEHIRIILKASNNLNEVVSKLNGLNKGSINIGTINSVCVNWIPDIVKTFSKLYPNIEYKIFQGGYDDINHWLNAGIVDLGFISISGVDRLNLEITPLYKDRIMCVFPTTHKPIHCDYVTIDDIKNKKVIYQREGYDAETNDFLKKNRISVYSQFHIEDDQSLISMVESGFGICIMPELVLKNTPSNVGIYPIRPEEYRIIGLACMNKHDLSPAATRLHDFIVYYLERNKIKNL